MSSSSLGMMIEILVAVLLVTTILYCIILNSRLKHLRADEQLLKTTIRELVAATEIAERAIIGLKATTQDAEQKLGQKLRDAQTLHGELKRLTNTPPAAHYEAAPPAARLQQPAPPQPSINAPRQVATALDGLDRELNAPLRPAHPAAPAPAQYQPGTPNPASRDFRVFTRSAFSSRTGGN